MRTLQQTKRCHFRARPRYSGSSGSVPISESSAEDLDADFYGFKDTEDETSVAPFLLRFPLPAAVDEPKPVHQN